MLQDHPTIDDFEALFQGVSRPVQAARHLLSSCETCREQLIQAGWDAQRLDRLLWMSGAEVRLADETDPPFAGRDYGRVFASASRGLQSFFDHDQPLAEPLETLLADLFRLSDEEQVRHAAEDSRFAHPEVVRGLIEESHGVRYENPRKMLHLANLARLTAVACTADKVGNERRLADLRTRGWMQYGNALRVCSDLHEADEALATAQRFCAAGTRDPLLRARLLEQTASLRTFQGRFQNAIELADGAAEVYRELGESHSLASTMVQKAIASLYAGETEAAIRTLNRAIPLIDAEESPHLLLAACHNLIQGYVNLDRPEQALSIYFEARDLYKEFEATTIRLRAGWQEGQLLRDLGHLRAAEAALGEARKGFLERGIAIEVALISLDLASVYVRAGEFQKLKETVSEAVPIFRALRVGREAIAALLQLEQAAGQEQALELIQLLNTRLASKRHSVSK